MGLPLFILVSHQNTPVLTQGIFFFLNGNIKIWKDHANSNELLHNKVKTEVIAIFLCKYVVKELASNRTGPQFLFSKESGMEYTVIQINKQANRQKPLQYDLKPK